MMDRTSDAATFRLGAASTLEVDLMLPPFPPTPRRHPIRRIVPLSLLVLCGVAMSTTALAQNVSMAGSYSSVSGEIIALPQDGPLEYFCSNAQDARCIERRLGFFGSPAGSRRTRAVDGLKNDLPLIVPTLTPMAASTPGNTIVVPSVFFAQPGQDGFNRQPVLNNVIREVETDFTFINPWKSRAKLPDLVETRRVAPRPLSPANPLASGQNNGLPITNPGYRYRQSTNTTVSNTANFGLENVRVRYSGGLGFSGTMAALLRGNMEFYIGGPVIDNVIATSLQPGLLRGKAGNGFGVPFSENHGAGWDYTVMRTQPPGTIKGFPSAPSVLGTPCFATPPAMPAGCNNVVGFDTNGITLATTPGATSTRHLFAWTTGTVSVVRTAIRGGITVTLTMTAMGYDTVSTPTSAAGPVRRIGLVAGSYTLRNELAATRLEPSIAGMNLVLTPEPASTAMLIAGLGLLGALARQRRR